MILFDTTMLSALFHKRYDSDLRARVDTVVDSAADRIVIPTPALCECLAKADAARDEIFESIRKSTNFKIAEFGQRAARECAEMIAQAKKSADRRNEGKTWAKAKFDWQIVAIAIAESVDVIYSDDDDLVPLANRARIHLRRLADVRVSADKAQRKLDLQSKKPEV